MPRGSDTSVTSSAEVPTISRAEVKRRLSDASLTIVDVLSAENYAAGHLPRAINLPIDAIDDQARELLPDPNAEIAVYCANFT